MSDTQFWLTWLIGTVALEATIFWFIRKAKARGYIAKHDNRWWRSFRKDQEIAISESDKPARFNRIIRGWYLLMTLTPLISYFVLVLRQ